jgi:metal-responsive CopG/Arc/MetJ family transcriptional regulator
MFELTKGEPMANIKTAISIPKNLFEATNQLAEELNVSRSHLFVMAIQDFIERRKNRELLAQINEVYGRSLDNEESEMLRRASLNLRKVDW